MRLPTLVLFSVFSLAIIATSNAARRTDIPIDGIASGNARVIDGDTISINGERIRLHGIDAPEMGQSCNGGLFGQWRCGAKAATMLEKIIGGRRVTCERKDTDRYGRMVGVCRIAELDVGAEMVRRGMAWAFVRYSTDYVALEAAAREQRLGIWRASTETAWDYRAGKWKFAEARAPGGCSIKGNVNGRGDRIYHLPWSPWYGKVRMDNGTGKRWFCSEDEAVAAGWRPALVR
jgi:endonuclease YncB( thermonuclease family)